MHRRQLLHSLASGGVVLTGGCLSIGRDPDPFNFGITNWRPNRYSADVVLRKNDETDILDARVDVPEHHSTDEEPQGIFLRDLTKVTDDDVIDARVTIDGTEFDTQYNITCTHSENAENNLFFRIFSDEQRGMQFRGSRC